MPTCDGFMISILGSISIAQRSNELEQAEHVVLLFPVYWYSAPSLLKEWIDVVLEHGWAFGTGGGSAFR